MRKLLTVIIMALVLSIFLTGCNGIFAQSATVTLSDGKEVKLWLDVVGNEQEISFEGNVLGESIYNIWDDDTFGEDEYGVMVRIVDGRVVEVIPRELSPGRESSWLTDIILNNTEEEVIIIFQDIIDQLLELK